MRVIPEFLDHAENVVPPPAVQSGAMLTQLPQDLVHLERRKNRLDQYRRPYGSAPYAQLFLRHHENIVPEPRFQVAFEFWQIEAGTVELVHHRLRIVKPEKPEIEERRRNGLSVHREMLLVQMPPTRTYHQHCRCIAQLVALAFRTGVGNRPP